MAIKLGINGAAGRMGKAIINAARCHDDLVVTAAIEHRDCPMLGTDAGVIAGGSALGVPLSNDPVCAIQSVDVLIDFTTPATFASTLQHCRRNNTPIVVGTTGLSRKQRDLAVETSAALAIVLSPNMSIGINLCLELVARVAEVFGDTADVEIVEAHHRDKRDAPSGTALRLGQVVADVLGRDFDEVAVYDRHGGDTKRGKQDIGFSTIRAADIVGEHTVMFATDGERIEIRHTASSRTTFAAGALKAARWIVTQPTGLFDMAAVIKKTNHGQPINVS